MITVEEADVLILKNSKDFGSTSIPFESAAGRILAENIYADRDVPPCNRVTMDGIAIQYEAFEKGLRSFKIIGTQAAGDEPKDIKNPEECIEIMTGAVLPSSTDTIIRYEDLKIEHGVAHILIETINKGQNIHQKGKDKKKGSLIIKSNTAIDAIVLASAAALGKSYLMVKELPRIALMSTGDELVNVDESPLAYQVRKSNIYAVNALLQAYGIHAQLRHLPDDAFQMKDQLSDHLVNFDVLLISGGVSAGKFDHLPTVLKDLSVEKIFHKVAQRPGKPFWFGKTKGNTLVFAFPGNPVSTILCCIRYFIPWLKACLCISEEKIYTAILSEDVIFPVPLQYFIPANVMTDDQAQWIAKPMPGNGSGDYLQLLNANSFIELPMHKDHFAKGERYRIWPINRYLF